MTVSHSICYEASLDHAFHVGRIQLSLLDVPTVFSNFERFVARSEAMLLCSFLFISLLLPLVVYYWYLVIYIFA